MVLNFLFFIFFIILPITYSTYDDSLARNKFYPMASIAYSDNPAPCVQQVFASSEFIRQITVQCDSGKGDTCSGFTAVSHTDQAIIIAFRGSVSDQEIWNEVGETAFNKQVPFYGHGNVDDYFYNATNLLWLAGMKDDFLTAKNKYPTYEVWVTGHSLGAAEASIYAALISALGYVTPDKIKLITMGQPRVGDQAFADSYPSLVNYAYRVVHANDWVPALPPLGLLNYSHHQSEVWYDNNMAIGDPYIVCDAEESKKCSDSQLDINHTDHDYYFNKTVHYTQDGCATNGA